MYYIWIFIKYKKCCEKLITIRSSIDNSPFQSTTWDRSACFWFLLTGNLYPSIWHKTNGWFEKPSGFESLCMFPFLMWKVEGWLITQPGFFNVEKWLGDQLEALPGLWDNSSPNKDRRRRIAIQSQCPTRCERRSAKIRYKNHQSTRENTRTRRQTTELPPSRQNSENTYQSIMPLPSDPTKKPAL